jgi:hypothetical protein
VVVFLSHSRLPKLHFGSYTWALKADLRLWNEQVFGNVETLKKDFWRMCVLDGLEEEVALVEEEKLRKISH